MPCLLSAKAQSFSPQFFTNDSNSNLFLLPLKLENEDSTNILMLQGSQIVLFDSKDLTVKEEILLESQIEAFKFEQNELTVKLSGVKRKYIEGYENNDIPVTITASEITTNNINVVTTDNINVYTTDNINVVTTDNTSVASSTISVTDTTTANNNSDTYSISTTTEEITTITSKNCTWSLSSPIFTLNFSASQLTCHAADDTTEFADKIDFPIFEVIKNDHVAVVTENQLQILSKSDRKIVSSVSFPPLPRVKSLIWIDQAIFVFSIDVSSLKVLKFHLMQFIPPTNGCNWPLVTWSQDTINVHRAGAICPTWYKLKNSEVWDVLKSPIGFVNEIVISADGSCLLVCGSAGVALCDFFSRTWQAVPFPSLKHPKWLGSGHVVALTPDNLHLILISRKTDEIMKIPIGEPETIQFIDTYNNWQLLIQKSETISILAFDSETSNFTFIKTLPFASKSELKQVAYFEETLFTLDKAGNMLINNRPKSGLYESFMVLSTGHLLLSSNNSETALLLKDEQEIVLNFSPLAVLPFTNCSTVLICDSLNFSLHSQFQSKFLLPELFLLSNDTKILKNWSEDALFPLALEYILLGALGKPDILESLQTSLTDENVLCRAIVSLTRKIEVHEASNLLFPHLSRFNPLNICNKLSLNDKLNFLPYLAKSYFENESERKESIIIILDELFSKRSHHNRIEKVREFISAFGGLEDLFESALQNKIQTLWKSGRLFKAYELTKFTETEIQLNDIDCVINSYLKLDAAVSDVDPLDFRSWLQTHSLPKTVELFNNLFP